MEIAFKDLGKEILNTSKQFVFAGVLALTWTAKDSQAAVKSELPKRFTLRNKWTIGGIRIIPATKQTQVAEVYSKDWYIAEFDKGQTRKVPKTKDAAFIIPTKNFFALSGRSPKEYMRKNATVNSILKKQVGASRPFLMTTKSGKMGLFVRKTTERGPIALIFNLRKQDVQIKPRPWFMQIISKTYDERLKPNYDKALIQAFKSAL